MSFERHRNTLRAIVAALVAATAAFVLALNVALANTVLDYDANRTENPVADNITRLIVGKYEKLDNGDRAEVTGARLCIIEKSSGRVITEWVTDGTPHTIDRETGDKSSLNIDTVYILRELSAPEGYEKVDDIEFILRSTNFNTTGELLGDMANRDDVEFESRAGTGPEQAFLIYVYDKRSTTEEVRKVERRGEDVIEEEVTRTSSGSSSSAGSSSSTSSAQASETLPKMSDETSYPTMALVAAAGAVLLVFGLYRRRHSTAEPI